MHPLQSLTDLSDDPESLAIASARRNQSAGGPLSQDRPHLGANVKSRRQA